MSNIWLRLTAGRLVGPSPEVPMDATAPPVMTIDEVAEYLRIPRGSVYKLAQQGRIPCQKVGKHWRFRREAIERWLDPGERTEGTHYGQA